MYLKTYNKLHKNFTVHHQEWLRPRTKSSYSKPRRKYHVIAKCLFYPSPAVHCVTILFAFLLGGRELQVAGTKRLIDDGNQPVSRPLAGAQTLWWFPLVLGVRQTGPDPELTIVYNVSHITYKIIFYGKSARFSPLPWESHGVH